MFSTVNFRHFGGGRKGVFLVLRYVFIAVAAYLLIFQNPSGALSVLQALMIVAALASNLALSMASSKFLFAWYVEAPVLIADTLWVSWAIHSTGAMGQEFFLLYFFILFLAATSNSLPMVIFGAVFISVADLYLSSSVTALTTPRLLRIVFFFTVALFYGEVLSQIRRERQRADRGFAWAREIESKVNTRTGALQRMYVDLLIASMRRAEHTATLCRDLRARLQTAVENTRHLLDSGESVSAADQNRLLSSLHDSCSSLLHAVSTLDAVSTADDTRAKISLQPVRVHNLIADAERRKRPALNAQVEMQWKTARDLPIIESDPFRLGFLLESLVDNAVKFTAKGVIAVSTRDLPSRRMVELRVDDTGIGFDERDLPRLFRPFRQLEEKGDPHGRIGIGLAVVDRLVEQLGGELSVRSTLGHGSSFIVRIPYAPPAEEASPSPVAAAVAAMTEPAPRRAAASA